MPKVRHFKNVKSYRRFLAYVHIHGLVKHHPKIAIVGGKVHKIRHGKKKRR